MNPPYSRGVCQKATTRFIDEFNKKSFRAGVVLVNNMTDTVWFHDLWAHATRACFFKGRLSFMTADNKRESGNTRGQTLFLFEHNHKRAINRFDLLMPAHGKVT